MDQAVLAGLGNIYAAEALWEAEMDPRTPALKVTREKLEKLLAAIRLVLSPKNRRPGRYTEVRGAGRFTVYDREGKECKRCGGTILRIVQAGRSTYYCPYCPVGGRGGTGEEGRGKGNCKTATYELPARSFGTERREASGQSVFRFPLPLPPSPFPPFPPLQSITSSSAPLMYPVSGIDSTSG
ncbi:MAG: zinc finger domain-containing protein [Gemmatimonadaceae bacterium]